MDWLPRLLRPRRRADDGADHDEQFMREVQLRGDHEAFAQLLRRWEPPIRRLCIRMSGDEHRGEDLAQEAFIRAFAARRQFDPTRKFSTWLWRIALNLCFEESRRTARREEVSLGVEARLVGASSNDDAPDAQAIGRERAELVR